MRKDNRHISENDKKKGVLIFVLIGVLAAILFTTALVIFVPKVLKKNETSISNTTQNIKQVDEKEENVQNTVSKKDKTSSSDNDDENELGEEDLNIIVQDKDKVSISIKSGTLTVDGAVIVITDKNISPYSWTPIYKLQQKVEGVWQDMELLSPENAIFPEIEYANETGVMEQSLVWSNKYGQVGIGQYRIVKEASRNRVLC